MKLFLIIGNIIATALIIAVSYLLFFASPDAGEGGRFSDLEFSDTTEEVVMTVPEEDDLVDEEGPALIQISENPVLGFVEVFKGSSTAVLYVEGGTGHVYQYDVLADSSERVSNTTIQNPRDAVISDDGVYVVVSAGEYMTDELVIITLPQSTSSAPSVFRLDVRADNVGITKDNTLMYTTQFNGSTVGTQFDLGSKSSVGTVFTIPFTNTVVKWGSTTDARHYTYAKPAEQLKGSVYAIQSGQLNRLPLETYGLSALGNDLYVIASDFEENSNLLYDSRSRTTFTFQDFSLPEKCRFNAVNSNIIICAFNDDFNERGDLSDWRKGGFLTEDSLRISDLSTAVQNVININDYTSQTFDMLDIYYKTNVLFKSRADDSLWIVLSDVYETDI